MAIKNYANKAAYDAATLSTIESQVSLIETSREIIIDGVNIVTTQPVVGDGLFLDESNKRVYLKGGSWIQKAIIPSAWTFVGTVFARFGKQVAVINKTGTNLKYADVVQFKVTVPSASGSLTVGARFVTVDSNTSITVEYDSTQPLATAENTYEENSDTLCGKLNTALATLTLRGTWWAYLNSDGEVIIQRDNWSDYRDYNCSGAMTHVTWGDMPASDRYLKNDGGYTNYWGVMNRARTRAWATSNGRTPSAMEPIKVTGNPAPVKPACFEDSTNEAYQYTALIRAEYGTYDNYLHYGYGVRCPQKYGTFSLPLPQKLSATYALATAPVKGGGEKYKFPAFYYCYATSYGVDGLDYGDWFLPGSEQGCWLMADETLAAISPIISKMGTTEINNATSRWSAERYDVNYARSFSGSNGHLYYNFVNGTYRVQAVALLEIE